MIDAIIKGVFFIITKLASVIMYPIIAIITALFPSLGDILNNAILYFNTIFQFVPLCLELLMIPRTAIILLFDYYIIKYTIYISVRAVKAALVIYNKLKL